MSLTPIVPGIYPDGSYELTQSGEYQIDGDGNGGLTLDADSGVAAEVFDVLPASFRVYSVAVTADQSGSSLAFGTTANPGYVELTATISNDATLTLDPVETGGIYSITMSGYANLVLSDGGSGSASTFITFSGVDNNVFLNAPGNYTLFDALGFDTNSLLGDNIWVLGATSVDIEPTHRGSPFFTVVFNNGTSLGEIPNLPNPHSFQVVGDYGVLSFGDGGIFLTCFLRGTMIQTPSGERSVETLSEGDIVTTRRADGSVAPLAARWIGRGSRRAVGHDSDDAFPVRFRADAFADGLPSRDLLVTPEHCIFVDGCLIPARMLVNGGSIFCDRSFRSYEYFHVELDEHAILIANGLETESYLDTGNRAAFGSPGCLATRQKPDGVIRPAAPIVTERAPAEAIWRALHDRSIALGYRVSRSQVARTSEPDLRLLLASGACLTPQARPGGACFVLRRGERPVALLSRSISPARSIGPFVDDRRALGVAVERVSYQCKALGFEIAAAALAGRGWHGLEGDFRWTDGHAELALPAAPADGTIVAVRVVGTMLYFDEEVRPGIAAA